MEAINHAVNVINYDAGIVLIDLHQLNVKTTSDNYKSATLNTGQPLHNEEQPAEQQPATSALNQMIEQINIALGAKGSGNFSAQVIEACRRRLTPKREHIHQLKALKNEHPAFFPPNRTTLNSLNYEGIAVIELQFLPLSRQ